MVAGCSVSINQVVDVPVSETARNDLTVGSYLEIGFTVKGPLITIK
jgi:hypothetical protein